MIAQNWDWQSECLDTALVLHVRPDHGPELITLVEGGIVGRSGFNSRGVGVVGNYLQSEADHGRLGLPIAAVRRKILESQSLADAIGCVVNTPRAFSSNHLIADASGMTIDLEVTPDAVFFVNDDDGILEHSNHFRSPAAVSCVHDVGLRRLPDSLYRDRRLRSILMGFRGEIDAESIKTALRDHSGFPKSVCRHASSRADGSVSQTVASVIMDLEAGMLAVAAGPPCQGTYETYTLDSVVPAC